MSSEIVMIVLFAVLALVILFQLYNVLGRRVGRQPEEAAPTGAVRPADATVKPRELPESESAGVAALKTREPAFDTARFLDGARQAYETVVKAFSAGDRETLKPLLAPAVAQSFDCAIDAREAEGRSQTTELLHPPRADLDQVEVVGDTARARVRFLAELRTRSKGPEGEAVDDRRTAEIWTFERRIGAVDPNWTLARVEAAEA